MSKLAWILCAAVPLSLLACGGEPNNPTAGGGGSGAGTGAGGTAGEGGAGAGGSAAGGQGGEGGAAQGGGGTGGAGGMGGMGGAGGMGSVWPTCDSPPDGVPVRAIHDIWQENPAVATESWVPDVYVTAVSGGACQAGTACQFFVQQKETFASIAEGSQQALRVVVFPDASEHFLDIAVGARIDLRAFAYRHTQGGENELYFHVSQALPGCAKVTGAGQLVAVPGLDLEDLTVELYEQTMGPLFIRLETVSGKPKAANQTFALWEAFMPGEGPIEEVTSVSPFFLPNSQFDNINIDVIINFLHVDGVFGIFAPPADPLIKYEEIYVRSMDDMKKGDT